MSELLLRHIVIQFGINILVSGIVLDKSEYIGAVNVAELAALSLGDHDLDAVFKQRVPVGSLYFRPSISIVLQAFKSQLSILCGNEVGGRLFLGHMAGYIPNSIRLIQLSCKKTSVRVIADDKLHFGKIAPSVGKLLSHVDAVNIDMAIIDESIIVACIAALPCEDNIVGISGVTVGHAVIAVHRSLIGNAEGAVRIAAVYHAFPGIYRLAAVDLCKAGGSHGDGHNTCALDGAVIAYKETVTRLCPRCDQIGAALILKELQENITFVIGNAFGQRINKGIVREIGGSGCNAGQSGNDLVVNHVTCRGGAGVGVAIGNITDAAAVLARIGFILSERLFKAGDAGEVFGVQGHIVDPAGATVIGVVPVNGGHGERNEERCGSVRDHFGDAGFDQQIQAEGQIESSRVTISVRLRHGYAVIVSGILFQRVLDRGSVSIQRRLETVNQHIRAVVIACLKPTKMYCPMIGILDTKGMLLKPKHLLLLCGQAESALKNLLIILLFGVVTKKSVHLVSKLLIQVAINRLSFIFCFFLTSIKASSRSLLNVLDAFALYLVLDNDPAFCANLDWA